MHWSTMQQGGCSCVRGLFDFIPRTDAQRVAEEKKRKEKDMEMLALGPDNNELEDKDDLKVRLVSD